jgi:acetyl-CoA acetyltransferase
MASVIVAGARTPFGKFGGVFMDVPVKRLGAHGIRGQVLQAGGQITARQVAIEAGVPS